LTGSFDILFYEVFLQEDKTLNADATIRFFQSLEQHYSGKTRIHVFCDNAPYYRNRVVTEYLESSKIQLHFLPPYSPNLNPIERLWKWMKEMVVYNTCYSDFYEFRLVIFGFFHTLSGLDPGSPLERNFRSRVGDRFRAMGAPATS
jgi:transposase